jgi:peptide/nickel transport system permease protein
MVVIEQSSLESELGATAPAEPDFDESGSSGALRRALHRPGFVLALVYLALVLISAVHPSLFAGYGPDQVIPADKLQAPSLAHLFGTDELGRDLFSRVLYGSQRSLTAMGLAVGLAAVAGLVIGVISGFCGGVIDAVLMRVIDVALAIPGLMMALAIVTALGFGTVRIGIAVGVGIIPGFARVTRSEVLKVKILPYVEAARTGGGKWWRVVFHHVLPNSWGPVVVLVMLDLGTAILSISALSFLGFGAQPPAADWGSLVADGRNYLVTSPWLSLIPGIVIGLLVFSLNHIGRTMEELQR